MSIDPYHEVQSEIQSSLQTAGQLRASFIRIRSTAREGSEELEWARNELKATLAALEADLEDLEESVKIVESTGARMFGLDDSEVTERRRYVGHVRREIESMRAEVDGGVSSKRSSTHGQGLSSPSPQPYSNTHPLSPATPGSQSRSPATPGYDLPSSPAPQDGEDDDHQAQWAREEQQMMIREQDQTLSMIGGTLTTLAQQAGLMGTEIGEHNEMLDDLERGVDRSDSRLQDAMKKMRKFVRDTEEKKSGWCIGILVVILLILLMLVILL